MGGNTTRQPGRPRVLCPLLVSFRAGLEDANDAVNQRSFDPLNQPAECKRRQQTDNKDTFLLM